MEKILLRTEKKNRFGLNVLLAGKVIKFNSEGVCEIEDPELAKALLKEGLKVVGAKENVSEKEQVSIESLKKEIALLTKENEELKIKVTELSKVEEITPDPNEEKIFKGEEPEEVKEEEVEEDVVKMIEGKTKKELLVICEEMQFPEEEYIKLNARDLKDYMIGKLQ